jgi:hypothetical protein
LQTLKATSDRLARDRAGGRHGVNLSLGIVDFYDFFPTALDWSSDFNAHLRPPTTAAAITTSGSRASA